MRKFSEKSNGLITFIDLKHKKYRVLYWLLFTAALLISLLCILPPVWILLSGFKDTEEFLRIPPALFPEQINWRKLVEVWRTFGFEKRYLNSLILILGDWLFCIVLNAMAGFVLSRLRPKGTAVILALIFWTMMIPETMNTLPLFISFVKTPVFHLNITDTYLPMWLMAGANAFFVLIFRSFFDGIPMSYIDSARIDGCSDIGIFRRIIMPLSKPAVAVVSIFCINDAWGEFFWPYLVIKKAEAFPVAVELYRLKDGGVPMDQYMLAIIFSIIPPLILFCFFSRQIIRAMDLGSIKC